MHTKQDVVNELLRDQPWQDTAAAVTAFAPSNIALAKYWGKRNSQLNLPCNASLSIALADRGAHATVSVASSPSLTLNGETLSLATPHAQRLLQFMRLFGGPRQIEYAVSLSVNIPFAAGLASSACIFASLVLALVEYHGWQLPLTHVSILARLGSGSACRSLYPGFAVWQAGTRDDGMDSYATPLETRWPQLAIGLHLIDTGVKAVSSREGMQRTVETSPLYAAWPDAANQTVTALQQAIASRQFARMGQLAEHNALCMHATMLSAWPPLSYATEHTLQAMRTVWRLRDDGLPVYFTQDAGPNIKLLCQRQDIAMIEPHFPHIQWVFPFTHTARGN